MTTENKNEEQCGFWGSFSKSKKNRGYKWTSLVLVLVFLGGGGLVAWFLMRNAAHNLAGGAKYVRLSDNSASYGAERKLEREDGFFASEEELAAADPSLKQELLDPSFGGAAGAGRGTTRTSASASGGGGGAAAASEESVSGGYAGSGQGGAAHGSGLETRLSARGSGLAGAKGSSPSKTGGMDLARGSNAVVVQSAQGETDKLGRGLGKAPKTSVLEALKSAFKVNLYGARLSSQDSAREWIAKTFDANQSSRESLEYTSEEMKAKLDRINPDSIPKYLRDQSLDAASAKTLGTSEVDRPDFDKDGTKDALKGDKKYQSEKDRQDLAKALFNPLGPFGGGSGGKPGDPEDPANPAGPTGPTGPTGLSLPGSSGEDGAGVYSDPEAEQTLNEIAVEDFVATEGYGAECGCTPQAPCCCLPPNYFDQQCPMYGPFLPNDPCGAGFDAPVGDFPPPATDGTMLA